MPPLDPHRLEDRCQEEAAAALRALLMSSPMVMMKAGITITHHFQHPDKGEDDDGDQSDEVRGRLIGW